jgi:Pirin-related protein
MSRLDAGPEEHEAPALCDGPRALLLESRDVPLGGVRGMEVHRSLPQRSLPMVGAWCFLDRFGPQTTRMRVEPHPHIGLQTVTWPFVGEVRHRDAVGSDVIVRRGVLNLMTSGAGIAHSEYSVGESPVPVDALQLWVALPDSRRHGGPDFERHETLPVIDLGGGATATVVVGSFAGAVSPATMYTPIAGVEIHIPAAASIRLPLEPQWEYALLGVDGSPDVDAPAASSDEPIPVSVGDLLYLGLGRDSVRVTAGHATTLFLLGGEPFEADIVMWWNFVARSHEEIVAARDAWEADADPATTTRRFGHVIGHGAERIPAPPLPGVRLTQRRRR